MHITPTIVCLAVAILVLVNVAAVWLAHAKQRRIRAVLGLPERMGQRKGQVQVDRAIGVFEDTDAKLRKRAPHLSPKERHEMALAMVRAKGMLPPAPKSRR